METAGTKSIEQSQLDSGEFHFPWFSRSLWAVGGVLFLLLASAFVGVRTFNNLPEATQEFDWERRGMSDFASFYDFGKAFRLGINPYASEVMEMPGSVLSRPAAPFAPYSFLPFVPMSFMSLQNASIAFFVISWLMLGGLAWCCVRMSQPRFDWVLWVWVFAILVLSRPGHVTLFTGYLTLALALGTVIALHFAKTNPLLSGVGFMFAAIKPTYAIPLTILMLARRDFKAAAVGVLLTSVFTIGCLTWLASHSDFGSVIEGVRSGQEAFHDDPTEEPFNTWTRVDLAGVVAKVMHRNPGSAEYLAVMLGLLVVPCIALWKLTAGQKDKMAWDRTESGAGGLTATIVVLSILVTLYHHSYDCLIVSVAMVAMLLRGVSVREGMPRFVSISAGLLMAVPMVNYLSTQTGRDRLGFDQADPAWQLITMVNGICLLAALVITVGFALKTKTANQSQVNAG